MQLSVDINPPKGVAGGLADIQPRSIRSGISEIGTDQPFGIFVTKGDADDGFALIDAAGDRVIGCLVRTHRVDTIGIETRSYPVQEKAIIDILTRGGIFVVVEEAVTPDDPVYVRFANGIADVTKVQKGACRKSSDSNTARLVRGARFLSSAGAGELAIVEFDAAVEGASGGLTTGIRKVALTASGEAANAIEVQGQLQDANGNKVAAAKQVLVRTLAPTADKGDISAAGTPVGTLKKAVNPATGENVAWMTTTAAGAFAFSVADDAAEDVLVHVTTEDGITEILKLTFA